MACCSAVSVPPISQEAQVLVVSPLVEHAIQVLVQNTVYVRRAEYANSIVLLRNLMHACCS